MSKVRDSNFFPKSTPFSTQQVQIHFAWLVKYKYSETWLGPWHRKKYSVETKGTFYSSSLYSLYSLFRGAQSFYTGLALMI